MKNMRGFFTSVLYTGLQKICLLDRSISPATRLCSYSLKSFRKCRNFIFYYFDRCSKQPPSCRTTRPKRVLMFLETFWIVLSSILNITFTVFPTLSLDCFMGRCASSKPCPGQPLNGCRLVFFGDTKLASGLSAFQKCEVPLFVFSPSSPYYRTVFLILNVFTSSYINLLNRFEMKLVKNTSK